MNKPEMKVTLTLTTPDGVNHVVASVLPMETIQQVSLLRNQDAVKEMIDGLYQEVKKRIFDSQTVQ